MNAWQPPGHTLLSEPVEAIDMPKYRKNNSCNKLLCSTNIDVSDDSLFINFKYKDSILLFFKSNPDWKRIHEVFFFATKLPLRNVVSFPYFRFLLRNRFVDFNQTQSLALLS